MYGIVNIALTGLLDVLCRGEYMMAADVRVVHDSQGTVGFTQVLEDKPRMPNSAATRGVIQEQGLHSRAAVNSKRGSSRSYQPPSISRYLKLHALATEIRER